MPLSRRPSPSTPPTTVPLLPTDAKTCLPPSLPAPPLSRPQAATATEMARAPGASLPKQVQSGHPRSDTADWKQMVKPVVVVRLIRTRGAADQHTQVVRSNHNGRPVARASHHDKLIRQCQCPSEPKRPHHHLRPPALRERRARF